MLFNGQTAKMFSDFYDTSLRIKTLVHFLVNIAYSLMKIIKLINISGQVRIIKGKLCPTELG